MKKAQPLPALPLSQALSSRRGFLLSLTAAICAPSLNKQALAQPYGNTLRAISPVSAENVLSPTLMVAGSRNTAPALWAERLLPLLSNIFQTTSPPQSIYISGQDGVSGSNRFDTRSENEGDTALLVPGAAIIAALAGDSRVHFDYGRWIPVFLSQQNQIIIGHKNLPSPFKKHIRNYNYRIAVSTYTGVQLPTLLAFYLLNFVSTPVPNLGDTQAALTALQNGQVDIIQLNELDFHTNRAKLEEGGFTALFSLKNVSTSRIVPTFYEQYLEKLGRPTTLALLEGWKALAMAATVETAMVLPMLTPPPHVARWRHICERLIQTPALTHFADENLLTLTNAHGGTLSFEEMTPSLSAQLAIKRWLNPLLAEWR